MSVTADFEKWAIGYSGCDGGDIGSPESPSIWVCGIEWGGGFISAEWLQTELTRCTKEPPDGYESPEDNLAYVFNRQTAKLLNVISGGRPSEYRDFALQKKPFVKSSHGYFKMNLYPISFKDTGADRWSIWIKEIIGLSSKDEYISWCKVNRFPFLLQAKEKHKPKCIVCFGKTYKDDFVSAFCGNNHEENMEKIGDRELYWYDSGETKVFVCPFPTGPYGLNSDELIKNFGEKIRSIAFLL